MKEWSNVWLAVVCMVGLTASPCEAQSTAPVRATLAGPWSISVSAPAPGGRSLSAVLHVEPLPRAEVRDELHPFLPLLQPKKELGGWGRGLRPMGIRACETTEPHALDVASVSVRPAAMSPGKAFQPGVDYDVDPEWGTIGRLETGAIGAHEAVTFNYGYYEQRIDSVILTADRALELREGVANVARPLPPDIPEGSVRLANIWVSNTSRDGLKDSDIFVIRENGFPDSMNPSPGAVQRLLPKTIAKLKAGEPVKILAWGDSVTAGGCLDGPDERWQDVFVGQLRKLNPRAQIELVTEAWPARNSEQYLAAPSGDPHNFQAKVLDAHPDLIVSEFINDRRLSAADTVKHYAALKEKFQSIAAEWIVLTPAYSYPGWMDGPAWRGITDEREIDDDPRPYVQGLRTFAAEYHVALADASLRWGRLWRQGIPYTTLLANSINHPDARGHRIYANALLALFSVPTADESRR